MNIYPTIEALLHYANAHLLFDELDYIYARNRILELMHISDYEEYEINDEEIDNMTSPKELLDALCTYAIDAKIIEEQGKELFRRKLMSCVLLRPSEVADTFTSLNSQKAFEWLNDFGVKSGYIKTPEKKWECKGTRGKLEVVMTGCSCAAAKKAYPSCKLCRDNEGYGNSINRRTVPIELYGERMFFYYMSSPIVSQQSKIIAEYHRPLEMNSVAINKMFDFISLMPSFTICANECEHESYSVTSRLLPLNKAPDAQKHKSEQYPYIQVSSIDWYISSLRLVSTNREKLIEYAEKLIKEHKLGGANNSVMVCLRKAESNYVVEILFYNKAEGKNPIACTDDALALCGAFAVKQQVEQALKDMERFLTKEEKLGKLSENLEPHSDMINRLVAAQGNNKVSELEASLDIKDESNRILEAALTSMSCDIESLTI